MQKKPAAKNAIVLAMFGSSVELALPGLLNIRDKTAARFPGTPVSMAFTSETIRRIWRQRANDPEYVRSHQEIPDEILTIRSPVETIESLQDAGFRSIVVQAVHMAPAEEYTALCAGVSDLRSGDENVPELVIGRPALGSFDNRHPYKEDLRIAAVSLAEDIEMARREKAALVYMGHGNRSLPAENIYTEFAAEMQRQYPEIPVKMITIEGVTAVDMAIAGLRRHNASKVLLKPFLIAAGGHVIKDMLGRHPHSLRTRLEQAGFEVRPVLRGLGEQDRFAQIFVQHAADAAQGADIELR